MIPPRLPGSDTTRKGYPHDVAKAKQLLAAAGHRERHRRRAVVLADAAIPAHRADDPGESRRGGHSARRSCSATRRRCAKRRARGQTDLALKEWWADYPDAENFLYPLLHSKNKGVGGNVSFYSNPKFDKLVSDARREQDEAKRVSMYRDADMMAFNDAPMIYLFFYKDLYAVQPWITGFVRSVDLHRTALDRRPDQATAVACSPSSYDGSCCRSRRSSAS